MITALMILILFYLIDKQKSPKTGIKPPVSEVQE